MTRFILASASPARIGLLNSAGITAEVLVSGVDESTVDERDTRVLCRTLARMKAESVAGRVDDALVLGCDTMLEFDGVAYGKPRDGDDAVRRWRAMRGRQGVLHTGHCLVDTANGGQVEAVGSTVVHFADITDDEIAAYVATGEPLRVGGGFTIDGFGGPFVERIEGDHSNVVGLSMPLLRRMLGDLGIRITDLWRRG